MDLNYIISGLKIRFSSELDFEDCGDSPLFSGDFTDPDCILDFSVSENLPAPEPKFADGFIGLSDDGQTTVFYDRHKKAPMYSVTKNGSGYKVLIPEEKYLNTRFVWNCIDLPGLLLDRGRLMFHCSFIIKNGEAVLFCGRSGIGKSTQAALWEKYADAEIINGDKAAIFCENGVVYASSLPVSGTSGICRNKTAPVRAIISLGQGKENRLKKTGSVSAMTGFLGSCIFDSWRDGEAEKCLNVVSGIIGKVPQYNYFCLPDASAVRTLCKELYGE